MPAAPPPKASSPDLQMVFAAIDLLKSDGAAYRIEVDSDSLSMTDFDSIQQENMAVMEGTAKYFQAVTPLMQAGGPQVQKFFLELYQQAMAGVRGAERFEEITDRAILDMETAAAAPKPPPPPDPRLVAAQAKAQSDQFKAKADVVKTQMDMQASTAKHGMEMQKIGAEVEQTKVETAARLAEAQMDAAMGDRDTGMED
jgi:hypothetical protein